MNGFILLISNGTTLENPSTDGLTVQNLNFRPR